MQSLILFVLSALTLSPGQKIRDCRANLGLSTSTRSYSPAGIMLARSSAEFTAVDHAREAERRSNAMPNDWFTLASGEDLAARFLTAFAERLAERSGLTKYLINPEPLTVAVERTGHEGLPRARVRGGVVVINQAMLELAATDDELAEIVGHETLHHTLAHGLILARAQASPVVRALRGTGSRDMFSTHAGSVTDELAAAAVRHRGRAIEAEIHDAIGELLENAGYDQWAAVSLWEKQLALSRTISRPFFDQHGAAELTAIIEGHRARLHAREIQPRTQHSTVVVEELRALLRALPVRD